MKMSQQVLVFSTEGRGTLNISGEIAEVVNTPSFEIGLCHLFLQHTSASLMVCENDDEEVRKDLERFLQRLIPDGDPLFRHVIEGKDDMPAHIRTILTQTSLTIPIQLGKLALGTWQGIYLYEHRYQPQNRRLVVSVLGH